jgi:hypothetical protein
MSVVKLEISGLLALGFDRVQADALLHMLRQIGAETGALSLPEIAALKAIDGDISPAQAELAELRRRVDQLAGQVESMAASAAQLAELAKRAQTIEIAAAFPPPMVGTLGQQNADHAAISGGAINGTTIGATTAASGAFTTVSASGQVTSTLATGTAPLAVASTTKVSNLNVDLLDDGDWASPGAIGGTTASSGKFTTFGCNGKAPQGSAALGAAATDLPTVIALANNMRTALIANGIGA